MLIVYISGKPFFTRRAIKGKIEKSRRVKMKKKGIAAALALAMGVTSLQGCIGGSNGFVVTKKLYGWNQRISNKWVNEIVFLIMCIIPVYGVAILVDGIVLNSIEFWTGSNPLAMKPGEVETKYVSEGEKTYKIQVSMNRYHFEQITGPNMGEEADFIYNPESKTWLISNGKEIRKAAQVIDGNQIKVFNKNGDSTIVNRNQAPEYFDRFMNERI